MIEGPLEGMGIPQLFRDPAFLGALKIGEQAYNLPIRSEMPIMDEPFEPGQEDSYRTLHFDSDPEFAATQLAQPEGFAGSYLGKDRISAASDGLYKLFDDDGDNTRIALLPFSVEEDIYVGVTIADPIDASTSFEQAPESSQEDEALPIEEIVVPAPGLVLVERQESGCWTAHSIHFLPLPSSEKIAGMRERLLQDAAANHGMKFDAGALSGKIDGTNLQALLQDGQFTSGLSISKDFTSYDCPLEAKTEATDR